MRPRQLSILRLLAGLLLLGLAGPAALRAQESLSITPLVRSIKPTCLTVADGGVFCGTAAGGVVWWSESAPGTTARWLAGSELSSTAITDLAWTGRHLWVATADGGMTRVADPAGAPVFDLYANSLRSAEVTAVAGFVSAAGDVEHVWYGAGGQGLGEIIGDQPGALYTAETDGLVSNDITALVVHEEVLFVGSTAGVSRFVDNVFTDASAGLFDTNVLAFARSEGGDLYCNGAGGIYRWDGAAGTWVPLGGIGRTVADLAVHDGDLYALGIVSSGAATLHRWDGATLAPLALPDDLTEAIGGGTRLWLAGRHPAQGMVSATTFPLFRARHETGDTYTLWVTDAMPVRQSFGVTFGGDGRPWVSDALANSFAGRNDDGTWAGVFERAATHADSSGLINYGGGMFFMTTGTDGVIWTGQLGGGVLRHDPVTGHTDNVRVFNSGLGSTGIINGITHPDGPIVFLFDTSDVKAQVLVDPVHWRNPDNWVTVDTDELGGRNAVAAVVERRDRIWFASPGTGGGVIRWDVNGTLAGPDDPLTWTDPSDDDWSVGVRGRFPDTSYDATEAAALAIDATGRIWAGGNGLVAFRYDEQFDEIITEGDFGAKSLSTDGLISIDVGGVASDRNGDVWVVTAGGLNRIRRAAGGWLIDAWFDVVTFSNNRDYGILYSPSQISDLPGANYNDSRLVAAPGGDRLLLSCTRGVALLEVDDVGGQGGGDGSSMFLFPNPWDPDGGARLAVGGLPTSGGELLRVGIYTVEGQLVYEDDQVIPDEGFWSGGSRVGSPVVSGLYVVRVQWHGLNLMRTLAVVR